MKKQLKLIAFTAAMLVAGITNAQQVSGNITKQTNSSLGQRDTYVKVIDNKGTIKYLQAKNGVTTFTNTNPADGGEVTTWQLGGELSTNTTITTNGQRFTIDGQEVYLADVADVTGDAATSTTDTTGWRVMVRTASGQLQKAVLSEILKVEGIYHEHPQTANVLSSATANQEIDVSGLPAIANDSTERFKLFVFRNGAKLRIGTDYTVPAGKVVIARGEVPMYDGDVVEIQYVK